MNNIPAIPSEEASIFAVPYNMLTRFTNYFTEREKPPGQLIDVAGFRMHIHTMGPVNEYPTVILEAGLGLPTPFFYWVQKKLAKYVHTVSYDRAGIGWSEESHQPHDAKHMVEHLHTLLRKTGIKGPYILAGHSLAGLIMRVYAGVYRDDIAGMVFIDASRPELAETAELKTISEKQISRMKQMKRISDFGLDFLNKRTMRSELLLNDFPERQRRQIEYLFCQSKVYAAAAAENLAFSNSAMQAAQAKGVENILATAVTASIIDTEIIEQEDCASFVTGSSKIIKGSSHMSIVTNKVFAEQVADEILKIVILSAEQNREDVVN